MHNIKKYFGLIILVLLVLIKIHDSNFVKRIENISYDTFKSIFIKKHQGTQGQHKKRKQVRYPKQCKHCDKHDC